MDASYGDASISEAQTLSIEVLEARFPAKAHHLLPLISRLPAAVADQWQQLTAAACSDWALTRNVCCIVSQVEDRPGCLNEVTGVFARRGFNVQSLAVGTSETEGRSRITMVVPGGSDSLQNLIKQVRLGLLVHLVDFSVR